MHKGGHDVKQGVPKSDRENKISLGWKFQRCTVARVHIIHLANETNLWGAALNLICHFDDS